MRVIVSVDAGPSGYGAYDERIRREATVEAEIEAVQAIDWASFCTGLVEAAVAEYLLTQQQVESENN